MGKSLIALAAFVALLAAVPARATSPTDSDRLHDALAARYEAMRQATDNRDGAALGKLLAPNFQSVSIENQYKGRQEMINDVAALKAKRKDTTASYLIHDVRQVKDKAYVDETYRVDRVSQRKGETRNWRFSTNVSDVWVLSGGEWLLENSIANAANIFLNGEHVAHAVRGQKMRIDKSYREKMKSMASAARAARGASCGGAGACSAPPPQMTPIPPSPGH